MSSPARFLDYSTNDPGDEKKKLKSNHRDT